MEIKKMRKSNIEMLRIVLIIMVIAHHYVVNSGIKAFFTPAKMSAKMIGIEIFGCGGKIAIDGFIIITGFFMCKQSVTLLKWCNLFVKYAFYLLVINGAFLIVGYYPLGKYNLLYGFVPFIKNYGTGYDSFIALYLALFLLIPFINKLINAMNKKEMIILLSILIALYSIFSTFFFQIDSEGYIFVRDNFEGLGWYITVYLIGAFIRKYGNKKWDNFRVGLVGTIISAVVICISIYVFNYTMKIDIYHFVIGANKFMAITMAIMLFILFKNINIKNSKIINTLSKTTFGILLIHANSDTMRYFLWNDIIKCPEKYLEGGAMLIVSAITSVILIFIVCACIDIICEKFLNKVVISKLKNIKILNKELY